MTIIEITAGAACGFNHPYEDYANFKPSVTLKATIDETESAKEKAIFLQEKAQELIELQKRKILDALEKEYNPPADESAEPEA